MGREIEGIYDDVMAETIISRLRPPGETLDQFRDRSWREPPRLPDTSTFPRPLQPIIEPNVPPWAEPPWAEPEAEP
jgi:hypothetical protein